jgi:hypothetical protein
MRNALTNRALAQERTAAAAPTGRLRRPAAVVAMAGALVATTLTGSAHAATGGGCSAKFANIQSCASWITGQGYSYNGFLDGLGPAAKGDPAWLGVYYCATTTVATSSTSCNSWTIPSSKPFNFTAPGQYPSGGSYVWSGSRTVHGVAFTRFKYTHVATGLEYSIDSPKVFW